MAKFKFTIAAILLHLTFGGLLYVAAKNTNPEDRPLKSANYAKQECFVQLYEGCAEISLDCNVYRLQCAPYRNDLGEWEAVESPTGQFIKIGENGTTTAKIEGRFYTFLPE